MVGDQPPASRHGGNVYAAAARWGLAPQAVLDFSANLNPLGPSVAVRRALRHAARGIGSYPEPLAPALRAALSRHWGVPAANLAVGNGAAELIYLVARLAHNGRAVVPEPAFSEYARAVTAAGGVAEPWPLERKQGFLPEPDQLCRALRGAALLFLSNPHNPSGALLPPAAILRLADAVDAHVVVDEAFIEFSPAGEAGSVIQDVASRRNLIVLRSLTKFHTLPGLRVGAVAAPAELIAAWDATRDVWSVNSLAQACALTALADTAYAERTRAWLQAEREFMGQALAKLPGVTVLPSAANFFLCRAPLPAWLLQERLGPRGILIRDCRGYSGLDAYDLRLAIRRRRENQRLLRALREVLA